MENTAKLSGIKEKLIYSAAGVLTGLVNGFFGGGGGMLLVPFLLLILKRPEQEAHATALLIILPITLVSGIVYVFSGYFRWEVGLPVSIGVMLGGICGAMLLKKLNSKAIVIIFSLVMIAAGVKLLWC